MCAERQVVDYCPANGGGYDDPIAESGRQLWSLAIVTETERRRKIDRGQDSLFTALNDVFLNEIEVFVKFIKDCRLE